MRKEIAVSVALMLAVLSIGLANAASPEAKAIKDVSAKSASFALIKKTVFDYKLMSIFPDKTFKGSKAITRSDLSAVNSRALKYLEKKYSIPLTAPSAEASKKTVSRLELVSVLAKTLRTVMSKYEIALPTLETKSSFKDIKAKDPALSNIRLLQYYKIIDLKTTGKGKKKQFVFDGKKTVTRSDLAVAAAKLVDKLEILYKKYGRIKPGVPPIEVKPPVTQYPPAKLVEKSMELGRPQAFVTGAWGNIYERASGTNNWLGFFGSAQYGNRLKFWKIDSDYELRGKYSYNQLAYITQNGSGLVNENRFDLDANLIYPVVNFRGFEGKLLLGLKYAMLSNPIASTNFTALNAGVATIVPLLGRKMLGRAFYSLIPGTAAKNSSALGLPTTILNYELGTDVTLFNTPLMMGYSGETMFLNGGVYSRFYNMVFLRYSLN